MAEETETKQETLITAFALLSEAQALDADAWIAALSARGIEATSGTVDGQVTSVTLPDGAGAFFMMVDAPHPDVIANDPDADSVPPAHAIITCMGGQDREPVANDLLVARVAAAAVAASPAVAAMLGCGVVFRRADAFVDHIDRMEGDALEALVFVDLTVEQEADGRFSVLSHGLARCGREEFLVYGPDAGAAWHFTLMMAQWMLQDRTKVLPTGDTVGRTAEERIVVKRAASPIAGHPEVVVLELPAS